MSPAVSGPVKRLTAKIARSESTGIEDRWRWGLTVLRDPRLMTESGKSLRHGAVEHLIAAAGTTPCRNLPDGTTTPGTPRLSEQEIQRRLRCARAYPYASQIRHAVTDFAAWRDLVRAGFPHYDPEIGEERADPRTPDEVRRDRERQYAALLAEPGLFPLDAVDPGTATVRDLDAWVAEQEEIGASFRRTTERRRAHVEELKAAVCGDLTALWMDAERLRVVPGRDCGEQAPAPAVGSSPVRASA